MALVNVDDNSFQSEVLQSSTPVLVDFFATWCGPCKRLAPIVEEVSGDYDGRVKVVKCDIDEAQNTAGSLGIASVPTMIAFKDGNEAARIVGLVPKAKIEATLDSLL